MFGEKWRGTLQDHQDKNPDITEPRKKHPRVNPGDAVGSESWSSRYISDPVRKNGVKVQTNSFSRSQTVEWIASFRFLLCFSGFIGFKM